MNKYYTGVRTTLLFHSSLASVIVLDEGSDHDDIETEESDVIVTRPYTNFNFARTKTFALPKKVTLICPPGSSPSVTLSPATEHLILQQVTANLNLRGYRRILARDEGKPDIFLEVSVMATKVTSAYYDYWYPTWQYYYDPWYRRAHAPRWSPTVIPYVISAEPGTLILNATNPNAPDREGRKIPTVWVGISTGCLGDNRDAERQARVRRDIDQMFNQSPYLRRAEYGE